MAASRALSVLLLATSPLLSADIIYQNDFSTALGSQWLQFDTTTAQSHGPGIYETTELGLHLASSGPAQLPLQDDSRLILALHDDSVQFSDGILRGTVQRDTDVSRAGILFRTNPVDFSSYVVDFSPEGLELWTVTLFSTELLTRIDGLVPPAEEQWGFEIIADGSSLSAKTWPMSVTEPLQPQIEFKDSRNSGKSFGFHAEIFNAEGTFGSAFDDILLTTVPEPCQTHPTILALCFLFLRQRKARIKSYGD